MTRRPNVNPSLAKPDTPSPSGGGPGRGAAVWTASPASLLALLVLTLATRATAAELPLGCDAALEAPDGLTFRSEPAGGGQLGWLEGLSAPVRVRCADLGWVPAGCAAGARSLTNGRTCIETVHGGPVRAWHLGRFGLVVLEGEGAALAGQLPQLAEGLRFREGARHEDFIAGLDVRAPDGALAPVMPGPAGTLRALRLAALLLLLLAPGLLAHLARRGRGAAHLPPSSAEATTPPVHPLR